MTTTITNVYSDPWTGLLIGWNGKILSDCPDQHEEIAEDLSLIPDAIDEVLRYEPLSYSFGRYVAQDVEFQGPFDIHRKIEKEERHITFGRGPHFCLGANLVSLEGRIVLEEVMQGIGLWEVDDANARMIHGPTRGYELLPVVVRTRE